MDSTALSDQCCNTQAVADLSGLQREAFAPILSHSCSNVLKEAGKLVGIRDKAEDRKEDLESTTAYIKHPELEAGISNLTRQVLMKDADQYKPIEHADGSNTYTIVQIGISNRPENSHQKNSEYYSRKVEITVPAGAVNLGECQFHYDERLSIQEAKFNQILSHDRQRAAELNIPAAGAKDVEFYSHGVYTYSKLADTHALLLELTNGRPTVNIDWAAYPNTPENPNRPDFSIPSYLHYMEDRTSAKKSAIELSPAIDKTIANVGAEHTVMVGFSHGGMFDARYLRHRVDTGLPKIATLVLAHPDLPIKSHELHLPQHSPNFLLGAASSHTFVVGGQSDKQLRLARFTPFASGVRLGNDSPRTRSLLRNDHAIPITESDRHDPSSDQHLLNFAGIAELLNGDAKRSARQLQNDYNKASKVARQHR